MALHNLQRTVLVLRTRATIKETRASEKYDHDMKSIQSDRVKTALLLAAGTGSRLHPMTDQAPKCLTEVNGETFLQRLVSALQRNGVRRLVVVVGHLENQIRDYLNEFCNDLQIEYISNPQYQTTNNIYSLWLARNVLQERFLLIECDLIFDADLLHNMLEQDRMAISHHLPWMNGSTVTIDPYLRVTEFQSGKRHHPTDSTFKTVNIYSFSLPTWRQIAQRLEQHVANGLVSGYYETVLAELVAEGNIDLEAVFFDPSRWYEVDTAEDLREAETMFAAKETARMSQRDTGDVYVGS